MNYLCSAGRIPGAIKMATIWLIPKNAEKPADGRKNAAVLRPLIKRRLPGNAWQSLYH